MKEGSHTHIYNLKEDKKGFKQVRLIHRTIAWWESKRVKARLTHGSTNTVQVGVTIAECEHEYTDPSMETKDKHFNQSKQSPPKRGGIRTKLKSDQRLILDGSQSCNRESPKYSLFVSLLISSLSIFWFPSLGPLSQFSHSLSVFFVFLVVSFTDWRSGLK